MPTWLRRLLVLAILAALALGAYALWFRKDPVPVSVRKVDRGRVEETVANSKAGTVKTRRRAALSPETAGIVQELLVRKGQHVVAGDVLLRLSSEGRGAQLDSSRRALETANARVREACVGAEQADRDYRRAIDLAKQDVLSQDRLEQSRMARDAARAGCEAARAAGRQAQAAIDMSASSLDDTVLRAPFAGVIADLRTEVGEFVSPSAPGVFMQPVIDLIDLESVYVSAPLDEVDIGRVQVGLPVRITLDPYDETAFPGRVARIAPYVDELKEQSRTFEAEVEFDPRPGSEIVILPGTTADVEVILRAKDDVLRIPSYALLEGDEVLVARDGVLVSVEVETGLRNWENVEIVSGLSEGEDVVVSLDRAEVVAGAKVIVSEASLK
jgi:HlyD family secretion protein